jgi:hypothetical protein
MIGPPASPNDPKGPKTAGNISHNPGSEAFIAEMAARATPQMEAKARRQGYESYAAKVSTHVKDKPQPQTFDLTYRFTGTTKHDPRLMLESTFREGLPRGVTAEEVTDAD